MRCILALAALLALAAPARAQILTLTQDGQVRALDCAGAEAVLRGNGNSVTLTGGCRSLWITGNGNQVTADVAPGAQIRVEGDGNAVTYRVVGGAAPPVIALLGNSTVTPAGPGAGHAALPPPGPVVSPPPPAAVVPPAGYTGPVVLRGDYVSGEQDCAGRDAVVQGSASDFTLHGGCRSLTIEGSHNAVQAELAPGAAVTVRGIDNTVTYVAPAGAPPRIAGAAGNQIYPIAVLNPQPVK